eukprot:jgi/Tetstr1/457640/TSEL_044207.t1
MANFKELVAGHEGGESPRLADSCSYKPKIDVIIEFLSAYGALQANIDGSHRREAKRMVKENYPEIYKANKGIHLTSAKMYIGLSPEVCCYMSMKLNEAGHTVVGDTSMHKLLELQLLTPDEPARNWGKYLSDHIIEMDVDDNVSEEQAAARLDAIIKFRAKVDDLGPTGFPRKFQDLSKEHIAATNTTIRSEAYRIKNQMPDWVISFFTEFALLACVPELIAVSAPNVSNEMWMSMKAAALPVMPKEEKVDKDEVDHEEEEDEQISG